MCLLHDWRAARIKKNAVGLDGAVCVAARGESKVNVMGGPTAMTADSPSSLSDHPL